MGKIFSCKLGGLLVMSGHHKAGTKVQGRRNPHPSGRVPKYQNKRAFTHNPKSVKSKFIMSQPINGLCRRCTEQIEWKKKYRKYKPLKTPASCRECKQKTVVHAYHNLCEPCQEKLEVCAKCCEQEEIINVAEVDRTVEIEAKMKTFKERTKRTILRKLERGEIEPVDVLDMKSDKRKYLEDDDEFDDEDEDDNEDDVANDNNNNDNNGEAND